MAMRTACAVVIMCLLALEATATLPLFSGSSTTARMPVGTNIAPVLASHNECPYVDLIRCAAEFKVTHIDGRWYNPKDVTLRSDGYPAGLQTDPALIASTHMQSKTQGYLSGNYVVRFAGKGTVTVSGDAAKTTLSAANTDTEVAVTPSATGILLTINVSDASDPVRDISIKHVTHRSQTSMWRPSFINLLTNFTTLRTSHMQREWWSNYGDQSPQGWSSAPSQAFFTRTGSNGVPHEDLADLAKVTGKSVWISVPQRANDEYTTKMFEVYANAITTNSQTLYVEHSYRFGYTSGDAMKARVTATKNIHRLLSSTFTAPRRFEVLVTCDGVEICANFDKYLEPTHSWYDKDFKDAVSAFALPGEVFAGTVPWIDESHYGANPHYTNIGKYADDVNRIAWERMQEDEVDYVGFIGRKALLDIPVYAYEGGINLAVEMFGARYENPNSTDATIQNQLAANFHAFEERNDPKLRTLWLEWMERWYRMGGGLFMAGQAVAPGIKCTHATTHIDGANRWQCDYRGLTRSVDAAQSSHKFRAVQDWIANTPEAASLVTHSPFKHTTTCAGKCVWGDCNEAGACVCHAGYKGSTCETFDESLLPNGCSPNDYGANLGGSADWVPVWFWTNFMHFSRSWIHQPVRQPNVEKYGHMWTFDDNYRPHDFPTLDENGYPTILKPNDALSTFQRRDTYEYPHGRFHFFYDGEGTVVFGMDTHVVQRVRPGYIIIETKPVIQLNNGLWFKIIRTNPDDHVRNVKIIPDSVLGIYKYQTFHPLFLQSVEKYKVLRFMSLQHVGGDLRNSTNEARSWSDRTKPTFYSQVAGRDGWSIEFIVALANKLHIRPWISVPYNADDNYIAKQAKYLKDNLNPRLKPIIEYSNEVWATHHYAGFYAADMAVAKNIADGSNPSLARSCWVKYRSVQIFNAYKAINYDVTRVLGGQAVGTGVLRNSLTCANTGSNADIDMLIIAPYFGVRLETEQGVATLSDVFSQLPTAINATATWVAEHKALATEFNIPEVGLYEAGPSFFGGARGDDPDIEELGKAVHRDSRMKGAVLEYFDALRAAGSTLQAYFTAPAGKWSKYGAWGIREYLNQDPALSFKAQGYEAFAEKYRPSQCTAYSAPTPSSCPGSCNAHGTCLRSEYAGATRCECYMGYRGSRCETSWRIPNTQLCNRFTCADKNGTCQVTATEGFVEKYTCTGCSPGWIGWHCHVPDCGPQKCNFAGKCAAPNTCKCFRGHTGPNCEIDCGCEGHGVCTSDYRCNCDDGYKFENGKCVPTCACATCLGPNVCGCDVECKHGACYKGTCSCWAGYEGAACDQLSATPSPNAKNKAGINVAGIADWTSTTEFVNLMDRSRSWFVNPRKLYEPSNRWTVRETLDLRRDGYPASIPKDRVAGTFAMRDTENHFPAGNYTVHYDGEGVLVTMFDAQIIKETQAKGFFVVRYTPRTILDNGFYIRIEETNPKNPIRNIRIYAPGFDEAYDKAFTFNPAFLKDLESFRAIRFMNWANLGATWGTTPQGSHVRTWDKRTRRDSASMHTGYGVSEERMIDLCNWLNADPWITIPHDANDEYVANMAKLFKLRLRPDVKIHVEHSNEVWNMMFESHKYAVVKGAQQFPQRAEWERPVLWHGYRSQQIFQIFANVFGDSQRNRLQFKLGTFALSPIRTELSLSQVTIRPLQIAITTYFCDEHTMGGASAAMTKSESELVNLCRDSVTKETTASYLLQQAKLARDNGLGLDSYEGGVSLVQHNVMFGGYARPGIADLYRTMHRDPAMETIVPQYLDGFDKLGVDLNMWFTSASKPSIYGHWGIKESTAENCDDAPKCKALATWIANNQNDTVRRINWGLGDYGVKNSIKVTFSTAPSTSDLDKMARNMEASQNLPANSIEPQVQSTSSRRQSGSIVLFVIVGGQAATTSSLANVVDNIDINKAASDAGVTTVQTHSVEVASTPIDIKAPLPTDIADAPETFDVRTNSPNLPPADTGLPGYSGAPTPTDGNVSAGSSAQNISGIFATVLLLLTVLAW